MQTDLEILQKVNFKIFSTCMYPMNMNVPKVFYFIKLDIHLQSAMGNGGHYP